MTCLISTGAFVVGEGLGSLEEGGSRMPGKREGNPSPLVKRLAAANPLKALIDSAPHETKDVKKQSDERGECTLCRTLPVALFASRRRGTRSTEHPTPTRPFPKLPPLSSPDCKEKDSRSHVQLQVGRFDSLPYSDQLDQRHPQQPPRDPRSAFHRSSPSPSQPFPLSHERAKAD